MIIKSNRQNESFDAVKLKKTVGGRDADDCGAFREGEPILFTVIVPRQTGASGVVLRLTHDGGETKDYPFEATEMGLFEEYSLTLSPKTGLYFYEILILRGLETLFSDTYDNLNINFSQSEGNAFTLLIYDREYTAPSFLAGGVMYHVFVDRFSRSDSFCPPRRDDAEYENDWYAGKLQYAEKKGGEVKNNRFFGGNLYGVCEKLDYLKSLGVTTLYLSPIFEAYSNHKYDTGNYLKVDAGFGGDDALCKLITEAHEKGIRIILDGVFNHTGDDSLYFNKKRKYPSVGAYSGRASDYYNWYNFTEKEDGSIGYESWWGIEIMPRLNQRDPECRAFFCGSGGVCEKYMNMGIDGFRLDVADELCDEFLYDFRDRMRKAYSDAALIGEVWENAVTKSSYGQRRHYFEGKQLDSVMNYPFRTALVDAFLYADCEPLASMLTLIYTTYPRAVCHNLMNIIGTHDTERILSVLGGADGSGMTNAEADAFKLSEKELAEAKLRLMAASAVQYTVYGFPSLYYGDEAGMEGLHDPFCRRPYPWGREDNALLSHYKKLGELRRDPVFSDGAFSVLYAKDALFIYSRGEGVTVAVNFSDQSVSLPVPLCGKNMLSKKEEIVNTLSAYAFKIIDNR